MLRLRCVIAHKTLSSPRFQCENTAMGMPYFHGENLAEFCIWCAIAHRQGVAPIYTTRIDMLILRRVETPQSIKRVDACQCLSHTWGNHCHWVTRIGKITLWCLCTQYSMNMHLRQLPWAHTHTTRSTTLMTRDSHSCSHESPSYKAHNHSYTGRHIYIYIYTYIMHNVIT